MAARLASILVAAIVATTLVAGLIVGAQRDDSSGPVDLIVHNARVYAADDVGTIAEAVAIRGNKILKVGSEREIMRYRRPQTTVIDARGAAVLPGFNDAHVAFVAAGLARDTVQLRDAATLDDIQARLTAFVEAHPDAASVLATGWSPDSVSEPGRAQLDAAISDRPVVLLSHDGQTAWLNTTALAATAITRRTASPKNGTIARDRRGDATGVLKGAAVALADRALPKATREDRARALQAAIREAQQHGITSIQDLGAGPGDLDLYDAARDNGTLGLRVYAAMPAATAPDDLDAVQHRFPDDPLLKTGIAAVTIDGSVESQTAAMLTPYATRGATDGALTMAPEELSRLAHTLDGRGWQIAIQASGDRAVRAALDALASVAKAPRGGKKVPRHRIEGLTVIDPDDLPRFGALGIVASLQPLHAGVDALDSWSRNLGPDRVALGWPARSLSAAGAHLAMGSDAPLLPLDALASLRAAVTRAEMQAPEQLTLKSAINGWTSGAAWASFDDHRKGTLKPGMLADLVVLSTDIFHGTAQLSAAQVAITIFDGKVVYRRPS